MRVWQREKVMFESKDEVLLIMETPKIKMATLLRLSRPFSRCCLRSSHNCEDHFKRLKAR